MAEVLGLGDDQVRAFGRDFMRAWLVYLTGWPLTVIDEMGDQDAMHMLIALNKLRQHTEANGAQQVAALFGRRR